MAFQCMQLRLARTRQSQQRPTKACQIQPGLLDPVHLHHIRPSITILICENLGYATYVKKVSVLDLYSDLMILMYHTYMYFAILQSIYIDCIKLPAHNKGLFVYVMILVAILAATLNLPSKTCLGTHNVPSWYAHTIKSRLCYYIQEVNCPRPLVVAI